MTTSLSCSLSFRRASELAATGEWEGDGMAFVGLYVAEEEELEEVEGMAEEADSEAAERAGDWEGGEGAEEAREEEEECEGEGEG